MPKMPTRHSVDIHVGKQLRVQRTLLGLSQIVFAEQLGITSQQLQKYESGANRISAGCLWQASKILGVPISYFFKGLNREEEVAAEDADAWMNLVHGFESSPEEIKKATCRLLKSMIESPKPRPRKKTN